MAELVEPVPAPEDETYTPLAEREWPREWMGPFLHSLSLIPSPSAAARAASVAKSTAYRYRDPNDTVYHEPFAAAWQEAIQLQRDNMQRVLHQWVTTGLPVEETLTEEDVNEQGQVVRRRTRTVRKAVRSERLMELWMRSWFPERYGRPVQTELTGAGGGPIQIETVDQIDAQIRELNEELARRDGALVRGDGTPVTPEP